MSFSKCYFIKYIKRNTEILFVSFITLSPKYTLTGEWYTMSPIYYRMSEDFPLKS